MGCAEVSRTETDTNVSAPMSRKLMVLVSPQTHSLHSASIAVPMHTLRDDSPLSDRSWGRKAAEALQQKDLCSAVRLPRLSNELDTLTLSGAQRKGNTIGQFSGRSVEDVPAVQ